MDATATPTASAAPRKVTLDDDQLRALVADAVRAGSDTHRSNMVYAAPPPPTTAQKALTIHPKVAAPLVASPITVLILYVLSARWGVDPPAEVAASITAIVAFIAGYFAPSKAAPPE